MSDNTITLLPCPLADGWLSPDTYVKDGTLVCLLIQRHRDVFGEDEANPTSDVGFGETWETIGWNNAENTEGETGWQFAGWSWEHDTWTEGSGKVVGWKPYPSGSAAIIGEQTNGTRNELEQWKAKAEAALAALSGWKLVPEDATPEMVAAALKCDWTHEDEAGAAHNVYHAMMAASPPADRVVTALAQIDRALGRDNVAANPLRRVDYPKGRFGPAMLDGDDELNTREMKLIANSHGFELRVAIEEWDIEAAEILERNGTFGEALEAEDPPQSIVGGYQLVGAWEGDEGGLVTVYARPLKGAAAPGASS